MQITSPKISLHVPCINLEIFAFKKIAYDCCSLQGNVPVEVKPYFFGASLVVLHKKSGGVRPIAVGCTLHRLVVKMASRKVKDKMALLLSPKQLGYRVHGGAEAAVHAARYVCLVWLLSMQL